MALYKHTKEREVIKERDFLYSLVEGSRRRGGCFCESQTQDWLKLKQATFYLWKL